jgi:hypothetical protein
MRQRIRRRAPPSALAAGPARPPDHAQREERPEEEGRVDDHAARQQLRIHLLRKLAALANDLLVLRFGTHGQRHAREVHHRKHLDQHAALARGGVAGAEGNLLLVHEPREKIGRAHSLHQRRGVAQAGADHEERLARGGGVLVVACAGRRRRWVSGVQGQRSGAAVRSARRRARAVRVRRVARPGARTGDAERADHVVLGRRAPRRDVFQHGLVGCSPADAVPRGRLCAAAAAAARSAGCAWRRGRGEGPASGPRTGEGSRAAAARELLAASARERTALRNLREGQHEAQRPNLVALWRQRRAERVQERLDWRRLRGTGAREAAATTAASARVRAACATRGGAWYARSCAPRTGRLRRVRAARAARGGGAARVARRRGCSGGHAHASRADRPGRRPGMSPWTSSAPPPSPTWRRRAARAQRAQEAGVRAVAVPRHPGEPRLRALHPLWRARLARLR